MALWRMVGAVAFIRYSREYVRDEEKSREASQRFDERLD
jgi:hypothetical protein